ncbi:MAG: porin [Curvibacter sp.]|nr:porin [Curvibacter sp.]
MQNRFERSLLALAAVAALGASTAAQAQSSVTLFGVVDLAVESVKSNAGTQTGLAPSGNTASRLGFRGTEDLGGGLAASFWLEAALAPNSGIGSSGTNTTNGATSAGSIAAGGLTFNRRATLSLSGNFGELRLGRDIVPTFWNYTINDPFGAGSVGAIITNYTGAASTFVRASNAVSYLTPTNLGGFYGQGTVAFGNQPGNATQTNSAGTTVDSSQNGRYYGARVGYGQGPLDISGAYGQTKYVNNGAQSFGSATNSLGAFGTFGNYTDTNFGGSYDLGVLKLLGTVSQQKYSDFISLGNTGTVKGYSLGLNAPVGAANVLAQLSSAKLSGAGTANKWALGYVYNFSKNTAVYGTVARVTNSGGASLNAASFSSAGFGGVNGANNVNGASTGLDVGIRVRF